jgi:hypothetical protein
MTMFATALAAIYAALGTAAWSAAMWGMPYERTLAWCMAAAAGLTGGTAMLLSLKTGLRGEGWKRLVIVGGLSAGFAIFNGLAAWRALVHQPAVIWWILIGQIAAMAAVAALSVRAAFRPSV